MKHLRRQVKLTLDITEQPDGTYIAEVWTSRTVDAVEARHVSPFAALEAVKTKPKTRRVWVYLVDDPSNNVMSATDRWYIRQRHARDKRDGYIVGRIVAVDVPLPPKRRAKP